MGAQCKSVVSPEAPIESAKLLIDYSWHLTASCASTSRIGRHCDDVSRAGTQQSTIFVSSNRLAHGKNFRPQSPLHKTLVIVHSCLRVDLIECDLALKTVGPFFNRHDVQWAMLMPQLGRRIRTCALEIIQLIEKKSTKVNGSEYTGNRTLVD